MAHGFTISIQLTGFYFHNTANFTSWLQICPPPPVGMATHIHRSQKNVKNSRGRLIPTNEAATGTRTQSTCAQTNYSSGLVGCH